jgi:hypothetical protein
MKNQMAIGTTSTLHEWTSFLTVLNESKNPEKPLLKKTDSPSRLVYRLAKQFAK